MISALIFQLPSKPSTDSTKIEVTIYTNLYRNRLQLVFKFFDKWLTEAVENRVHSNVGQSKIIQKIIS